MLARDIFKATWYMAKAGLRSGAILGGLFGMATAILLGFGAPNGIDDATIGIFGIAAFAGALVGGALGMLLGVVDGPILVLLIHRLYQRVNDPKRRRLLCAINGLMVVIGVVLTLALVMGVDVVIGIETRHPLAFYSSIALIAGGAFWYATGKFVDKEMGVRVTA